MRTMLPLTLSGTCHADRTFDLSSFLKVLNLAFRGLQLGGANLENPQSHDVAPVSEARNRAHQILASSQ